MILNAMRSMHSMRSMRSMRGGYIFRNRGPSLKILNAMRSDVPYLA
jgi:hypothetical protein